MAYYDTTWYCNGGDQATTGYFAVSKRPQNAAVAAGQLVRQFTAPTQHNERVFVCIVGGTTANVTDATWVLTRGAKTTDNTVTWQECTGASAVNGDLTNTPNWTAAKAIGTPTLGAIIKRNNGASYQICTTAGTLGAAEPSFSDTAGVTTTETSATTVWTSLGVVGNFTGGQAPHAFFYQTLQTNWFAPGNTIYIGDNHTEPVVISASYTVSSTPMARFMCHNHAGPYPPTSSDLRTGATITSTVAGANSFLLVFTGSFYVYGMTFVGASGATSGNNVLTVCNASAWTYFDACTFGLADTGSTGWIIFGSSNNNVITLNNCQTKFGSVGTGIVIGNSQFLWRNSGAVLASGSVVPTSFVKAGGSVYSFAAIFEGLDLSQLTGNIFSTLTSSIGSVMIKDCKFNASAAFVTPPGSGQTIQLVRSDSGATAYKSARYQYEGTETSEISITRVGGAADPTGQAQSRKLVTTANSSWLLPFRAEPYAVWNPTTGTNVTVTVYGTINAGALPNNDDIWLEVEYLGSSASPLGTIVTTTKANLLATNAAVASDGSTWNGGGSGAGWSPFKLTTTLSAPQPGFAGYLEARVRAAKPSTTFYLDPQITLS